MRPAATDLDRELHQVTVVRDELRIDETAAVNKDLLSGGGDDEPPPLERIEELDDAALASGRRLHPPTGGASIGRLGRAALLKRRPHEAHTTGWAVK